MSQGYDQFFKAAKAAKTNPGKVKAGATRSRPRKSTVAVPRRRTDFPWGAFAMGLILLGLMAGLTARPEVLDILLTKVEIRWMGSALANKAGQKGTGPGSGSRQEITSQSGERSLPSGEVGAGYSLEDMNHFSRLAERKQQLDQREAQLNRLEEELHRQKGEVDERIRQLEDMRKQIAEVLKDRVETDRERVDRLVEVYSNMRPQQAAQIIANLNDDLAVEILGNMKRQNAAEILNVLDPEKAQALTEKFAGYKR